MSTTIRKLWRVEMAHQLFSSHTAACYETIHGHTYTIEVFFTGPLNNDGMVIDFGALDKVKAEVMKWDHALLMPIQFPVKYLDTLRKYNKKIVIAPCNPTAEWMAWWLLQRIREIPAVATLVSSVRVHETLTGYAEASL
jgi:6-pyruvoyltetrahydropterin/6-carboxytetrahydropterin synthase